MNCNKSIKVGCQVYHHFHDRMTICSTVPLLLKKKIYHYLLIVNVKRVCLKCEKVIKLHVPLIPIF